MMKRDDRAKASPLPPTPLRFATTPHTQSIFTAFTRHTPLLLPRPHTPSDFLCLCWYMYLHDPIVVLLFFSLNHHQQHSMLNPSSAKASVCFVSTIYRPIVGNAHLILLSFFVLRPANNGFLYYSIPLVPHRIRRTLFSLQTNRQIPVQKEKFLKGVGRQVNHVARTGTQKYKRTQSLWLSPAENTLTSAPATHWRSSQLVVFQRETE